MTRTDQNDSQDARLSGLAADVRAHDHDRFLIALMAPADARDALLALAAFNLEIAKTREVVSESMLGEIRLQWWRETVAMIYEGRPRRHNVGDALAGAVARHDLTRAHLDAMIDGREWDLTDQAPPTLDDLEGYLDRTALPLVRLQLEAVGVTDGAAHEAAVPLARAYGLTGLLRAVPFHARQRRVYLPTAVVEEVATRMGDLFELRPHEGLARAVEHLAGQARFYLADARARRRHLPRPALAVFRQATLADTYLGRLARAGHDVFDARVQIAPPWRQARLALAALRGRY
ncbi:MAG: phytoene/squalene synthase family protein [Azospirillaceae bacterium]